MAERGEGAFDVHHVIPWEMADSELGAKLNDILGKNWIQDFNNRVSLFINPKFNEKVQTILKENPTLTNDINFGVSQHNGSHDAYNQFIANTLTDYLTHPDFAGQPDKQRMAIIDFQKTLMNELKLGVDFLMSDGTVNGRQRGFLIQSYQHIRDSLYDGLLFICLKNKNSFIPDLDQSFKRICLSF